MLAPFFRLRRPCPGVQGGNPFCGRGDPDRYLYVYEQTNISGGIATPADYDGAERSAKGYLDGFSLVWGIEGAADQARNTRSGGGPSPFLALLLLGLGAWNLFAPKSAWWLARGWWYKNAEPSDLAIAAYRIGGVCLLIAGVICAIAAL